METRTGVDAAKQFLLLANATISEERWDAENQRMVYRVEYDAEIAVMCECGHAMTDHDQFGCTHVGPDHCDVKGATYA